MLEREPQANQGGELERLLPVFEQHADAFKDVHHSISYGGPDPDKKWLSLLMGSHTARFYKSDQQLSLMQAIHGVDSISQLRAVGEIDAHAFATLDELVNSRYEQWADMNTDTIDRAVNGRDDMRSTAGSAPKGGYADLQQYRYRKGMPEATRLYWVAARTAASMDVISERSYGLVESVVTEHGIDCVKKGADILGLEPDVMPRMLSTFSKIFPERAVGMLANDPSELLDEWASDPGNTEGFYRALSESEDAPTVFNTILQRYILGQASGYDQVFGWDRLRSRISDLEAFLPVDQQQKVVANAWFDRQFDERQIDDPQIQRVAEFLTQEEIEQLEQAGQQAAEEHRQAMSDYEDYKQRRGGLVYPEVLKGRDPAKARVLFLPIASPFDLDEKGRNSVTISALDVLSGHTDHAYVVSRYSAKDARKAYEEAKIEVAYVDPKHYKFASDSEYVSKLKIEDLSEETVIAMFGLTVEDHGDDEIVMWSGRQTALDDDKLAEAVKKRTGKYPHIMYAQSPVDRYEGHECWRLHEYVPYQPAPVRPTLQDVLTDA